MSECDLLERRAVIDQNEEGRTDSLFLFLHQSQQHRIGYFTVCLIKSNRNAVRNFDGSVFLPPHPSTSLLSIFSSYSRCLDLTRVKHQGRKRRTPQFFGRIQANPYTCHPHSQCCGNSFNNDCYMTLSPLNQGHKVSFLMCKQINFAIKRARKRFCNFPIYCFHDRLRLSEIIQNNMVICQESN